MRTLRFIVNDQILDKDQACDFSNLVPGSEGYLQASFDFSDEWSDCVKVAGFFSNMGSEYPPQVLKDGKTCMIPKEALRNKVFKIKVVGQRNDFKITTNKIAVVQDGGKI